VTRGSHARLLLLRNPSERPACENEATISAARATHRRAARHAREKHTHDQSMSSVCNSALASSHHTNNAY